MLLFGLVATRTAASDELVIAGEHEVVWLCRDLTHGRGPERLWRFAYGRDERDRAVGWRSPMGISELTGDLRLTVVRGSALHVWYGDGTHRSYEPDHWDVGASLPDAVIPIAVAGSDRDSPLHALVRRSVMIAMGDSRQERDADESDFGVIRLEGNRWLPDRNMPDAFDPDGRVWMGATGARLTVVFRPRSAPGRLDIVESAAADQPWSAPQVVNDVVPADWLNAAMCDGAPILMVKSQTGNGLVPMHRDDTRWTRGQPLLQNDGTELAMTNLAVAAQGSTLVGAWVSDDGAVRSANWAIEGGKPIGNETVVRVLSAGVNGRVWDGRRMVLAYVILVLVLAAVFVRRRESIIEGAKLPPEVRIAAQGRRLGAFCIDAAIFFPGVYYLCLPLAREFQSDVATLWQAMMADSSVMNSVTLRWLIALASFIVYCTIFESFWTATPGKRLLGLRVLTETGQRPTLRRILIRNVMRGVEFFPFLDLLPTLILIPLTRNHQRIGDLIAATVVVEQVGDEQPSNGNDSA